MCARYETIATWVNKYHWTYGAELGVSDGKTHLYLLSHCPQLTMVGVDMWDLPIQQGPTVSDDRCNCEHCNTTRWDRRKTTVRQREQMARLALRTGRSALIKSSMVEAASRFDEGSFDFVFIDGDHSYEGVSLDIVCWRPLVKPGGRVIGHDWNMKSVREAVQDHFQAADVKTGDDHLWWVDKP